MIPALWRESFASAWMTLRANRLRTVLTALTVSLGAGTMALLVSLATSALATIMTGVDAVGGREMIFVEQKDSTKKGDPPQPLTPQDAAAIRDRVPGIVDVKYFMSMRNQPVVASNGKKTDVDVGIGAGYPYFLTQEIGWGTNVTDGEHERRLVLCEPIAKLIFGSPEGALGKSVLLWQEHFTVVGVMKEKATMGFNGGGVSRTRAAIIGSVAGLKTEGIDPRGFIVMRDDGSASHPLQMDIAASVLRFRHHGYDDVEFFDMRAFLRSFDVVFAGIRVVVGLIAAVSLVIAGAGIMNVMLASIRQRISEIGIRRAVGASARDIRRQFLVEAVMIAALGGIAGSAVGTMFAAVAGAIVHSATPAFQSSPSYSAAIVAVISAGAAGLVFGLRPAQRASKMAVVECLRGVSS